MEAPGYERSVSLNGSRVDFSEEEVKIFGKENEALKEAVVAACDPEDRRCREYQLEVIEAVRKRYLEAR